jgi:hypothetical protein
MAELDAKAIDLQQDSATFSSSKRVLSAKLSG